MDLITANKLQQIRKEHGLSQDALAEKIGISRQSISKWERGESSPDTDNLIALAKVYNMSVDELLGTSSQPNDKVEELTPNKKEKKPSLYSGLGKSLFRFPMPLIIAGAYLIMAFVTKQWHPMWLMFLLIPIYYHFAGACFTKSKKGFLFALPVPEIVIAIYLCLGFIKGAWLVSLIAFIIIPIYYWGVAVYKK